jgi:hypothetical protein
MTDLADRLVQAVQDVLPEAFDGFPADQPGVPTTESADWQREARAVAAAVLRELDEYSDEQGPHWEGVNLPDLADEIEATRP